MKLLLSFFTTTNIKYNLKCVCIYIYIYIYIYARQGRKTEMTLFSKEGI
jgi:hypothetical protein